MLRTTAASIAALLAFGGANAVSIRKDSAIGEYLAPPHDEGEAPALGFAQTRDAEEYPEPHAEAQEGLLGFAQTSQSNFKSTAWNQPVQVFFKNESDQLIELFWHDYSGNLRSYGTIQAGAQMTMYTYATHPWSVTGEENADAQLAVDGQDVYVPVAQDASRTIVIKEDYRSRTWNEFMFVNFDNQAGQDIEMFWHDYQGNLRSYGVIGAGQTRTQYTYATHPWSAVGRTDANADLTVDGTEVFVPFLSDNGRTIEIGGASDFNCDTSVNFMNNGPAYNQISMTDACGTGNCAGNPKYGAPNNNEKAIAYCEDHCSSLAQCEGFFFQRHNNGHEICGFYASGMDNGTQVWHGHSAGAICKAK